MQRYRSYIEAAFQRSPHGEDNRVLLKRKKAWGETSSLKRILEKYIEKKSPPAIFFHFQEQFCTLLSEGSVLSWEGVEGREVVLRRTGYNENQLAGRHYLSIVVQECIDIERKNRPFPNLVRLALLFACLSPLSPFLDRKQFSNWDDVFTKLGWCRLLFWGFWYMFLSGIRHLFYCKHQEQCIKKLCSWEC